MAWPLDRIETLKQRWSEGASATTIAMEFHITRSAVLGQVHRMRQADPDTFIRRRDDRGLRKLPKPKATTIYGPRRKQHRDYLSFERPEPFVPAVANIVPLNIPLLALAEDSCRFPTTETTPFLFCGHVKQDESSYCAAHHKICNRKPRNISEERREELRERAYWMRKLAPAINPRGSLATSIFAEAAE